MPKILKAVMIIITIMLIIFIIGMIYITWGQKEVLNTKINEINLVDLEDGSYVGTFDGYRWTNSVKVVIVNKKIISIDVIKPLTFRNEEFEKILFKRVIDNQSVKVDTVASATISSKAILKAIENALTK